jgi:GNAT superfamily N-acetyltransferase
MNIRYLNKSDGVDWQQVSNLFKEVGWGARSPEKIKSAFQKSSFVRFAYIDDQVVGVGRTVDDGQYYGWIVDLAILPKFQGKGIGSHILNELEKDLAPYISTMLTAAPGKSGFYEKLGWLKQSAAYIWPRSEEQKRAFTDNC